MVTEPNGLLKAVLSALMFPMFFQTVFLEFAWGADDPLALMITKRLLLLLPVLALIINSWLTVLCAVSVLVRPQRQSFVSQLFLTWWDFGKAIAAFWGGLVRFLFVLAGALWGFLKLLVLGLWALVQDVLMMPFRLMRGVIYYIIRSKIPLIAVVLTLVWSVIEAVIFTYVTAPLVIDTFSNITGDQLAEGMIRVPLFVFMLFIILGSYAVLSSFVDALKTRSVMTILSITVIEVIVMLVEVVFLYREFVDSLVPWLAQYSQNFELGIVGTLSIATVAWIGVRSLSWFLFAAHGTPTILAVIQGRGIELVKFDAIEKRPFLEISSQFLAQIKQETEWLLARGEDLMGVLALPPLQIAAAVTNFCSLLVTGKHIFAVPFAHIRDVSSTRQLMEAIETPRRLTTDSGSLVKLKEAKS